LQNFPQGGSFYLDIIGDDSPHAGWTYEVLSSLRKTLPIRIVSRTSADYILKSGIDKENFWHMQLIDSKLKKKVWSERLSIKENNR
jgi:hypothetical protein